MLYVGSGGPCGGLSKKVNPVLVLCHQTREQLLPHHSIVKHSYNFMAYSNCLGQNLYCWQVLGVTITTIKTEPSFSSTSIERGISSITAFTHIKDQMGSKTVLMRFALQLELPVLLEAQWLTPMDRARWGFTPRPSSQPCRSTWRPLTQSWERRWRTWYQAANCPPTGSPGSCRAPSWRRCWGTPPQFGSTRSPWLHYRTQAGTVSTWAGRRV